MRFRSTRQAVVETCIELADRGYLAGTGGNVALRADGDHLVVTPSATDYYAMGPADVCVVRLADARQVEGEKMASVEAGLHARVLAARPDCTASVHTHQPVASAYTLLDMPLDLAGQSAAAELGNRVPCVPYAPSGTGWLARQVGRAFDAATHACLMRNHGVVCVGRDVHEAMRRVATLEAACAAFFLAGLARGGALPQAVTELVRDSLSPLADQPEPGPET